MGLQANANEASAKLYKALQNVISSPTLPFRVFFTELHSANEHFASKTDRRHEELTGELI